MRLSSSLTRATFIKRLNRFAALMRVEARELMAHVPNSGRMRELLIPSATMFLTPVKRPNRKTAYDLSLVDLGHVLVSADARLPNGLVQEALERGKLAEFQDYTSIRREVSYGESRLDLLLDGSRGTCYIEVKSVTLVEGGIGLFPDAPTARGQRHMDALSQAVARGHRGAVIFVIQRRDARGMMPNTAADPAFCQRLQRAIQQGVEAYAYRCHVSLEEIFITERVPVVLEKR
ncbi:MAG: DNA/RNA nuclease SfsA [Chloroflexi bacterium]|nr:DNA/RNA nuclease SfsA [Chloroflexota bacterium]